MSSFRIPLLILMPALAILAACGGSDDSSGDSVRPFSSPAAANGTAKVSSNNAVKIPTIKDGSFGDGTVHVEVSGGKDFKIDAKGNGIATGGFAMLTFGNSEGTVLLSFHSDSKGEPGAVAVTSTQLATGGAWGNDCSVTLNDSATELKGEFNCKQVEGIDPKSVKNYKVRVTGNFSVPRE